MFNAHNQQRCQIQRSTGFTLVEMMVVVAILAIIGLLAIPSASSQASTRLRMTVNSLVADIEYAQVQSIGNGADPLQLTFDADGRGYQLVRLSAPNVAITNPATQGPYHVRFDQAANHGFSQMAFQDISVGSDHRLAFDSTGALDEAVDAGLTLKLGSATMQVRIDADTGQVSLP